MYCCIYDQSLLPPGTVDMQGAIRQARLSGCRIKLEVAFSSGGLFHYDMLLKLAYILKCRKYGLPLKESNSGLFKSTCLLPCGLGGDTKHAVAV